VNAGKLLCLFVAHLDQQARRSRVVDNRSRAANGVNAFRVAALVEVVNDKDRHLEHSRDLFQFEQDLGHQRIVVEATYILAPFGVWSIVLPAVVVARQRGLRLTLKELALLPAYYLLVTAAAWTAIFDLIVRPHYWAKTAHGRRPERLTRKVFLRPEPG
jgi:hypothetical protein